MARSISRLVLAGACVVALAGCGSGVGDPSAGRGANSVCRAGDLLVQNNPPVCCPQVAPYLGNDGYCYGSANEAAAYARCEESGFASANMEAIEQLMLAGIEDFGYSRWDLLDIYLDSCDRNCGNDYNCRNRCDTCVSAIVAALFDG